MSIFGKYLSDQGRALHDGIVKTLVDKDPKGAMQAEIQENVTRLHQLASLAAEAEGRAQADATQADKLQVSFDQHLKAADALSAQVDTAADPAVKKAKQAALDKILGDSERLKVDLDAARAGAAESRSDADARKADAEAARIKTESLRREFDTAIHEQERARIDAVHAEERRTAAERAAGLTTGLSNHDTALQALHSNTDALHQRAAAATMTADGLQGSSATDAEVAAALKAASGEAPAAATSAADRLKALRGG